MATCKSYVSIAFMALSIGVVLTHCKPRSAASTAKDNEVVEKNLTKVSLGQGFLVPPIDGRRDIVSIIPAQAVCVAPPIAAPRPPVRSECGNGRPGVDQLTPAPTGTPVPRLSVPTPSPDVAGAVVVDAGNNNSALPQTPASGTNLTEGGDDASLSPGGEWTGEIRIVQSLSEANEVTQLSASIGSNIPVVSGGLGADWRSEFTNLDTHFYVVFKLVYQGYLDRIDEPQLSPGLQKNLNNMDEKSFLPYCGNRYLHDRLMGGIFFGTAKFDKSDAQQMKDIKAAVSEIKTTYVPGAKAAGGIQFTDAQRHAFSSAEINYHTIGGLNEPVDPSLNGLVNAMAGFICNVASHPAPLIAWLKTYEGGLGGQIPAKLIPQESDLNADLTTAQSNLNWAKQLQDKIDGYPEFQQPGLAKQRQKISSYVGQLQNAIGECRQQGVNCSKEARTFLTQKVPLTPNELPEVLSTKLQWKANQWYYLKVSSGFNEANVFCHFPDLGTLNYGIGSIAIEFRGDDVGGVAGIQPVYWRMPFAFYNDYGPTREVPIANLVPYLKGILGQNSSNQDIAAILNVVAPTTGNDGTWHFENCYSK